jgi:hypothetical protein
MKLKKDFGKVLFEKYIVFDIINLTKSCSTKVGKINLLNQWFAALPAGTAKEASKQSKAAPKPQQIVFKDKREAMEAFKELLKEKNVPSSANW